MNGMRMRCEASGSEREIRTNAIMACEKIRDESTIQEPNRSHRFLTLVLVLSNSAVSAAVTARSPSSNTGNHRRFGLNETYGHPLSPHVARNRHQTQLPLLNDPAKRL